jgi:beta-glucosidase
MLPGLTPAPNLVTERLMAHFNVLGSAPPGEMAAWHNRLQELAEGTRLGIPVTISSDPRHAFSSNPGASTPAGGFSQWPMRLDLVATRDLALVYEFGDIDRQENLAVGMRIRCFHLGKG